MDCSKLPGALNYVHLLFASLMFTVVISWPLNPADWVEQDYVCVISKG